MTPSSPLHTAEYTMKRCCQSQDAFLHVALARTLTILELAFPCSYALIAVLTIGNVDTLDTKSGESSSGNEGVLDLEDIDNAGVG